MTPLYVKLKRNKNPWNCLNKHTEGWYSDKHLNSFKKNNNNTSKILLC
uniref:Uncharacterized protein n=1 Tax=Anguilla anguilla TaxID=7936 RepID=A0A0E9X0N8_ANGAN